MSPTSVAPIFPIVGIALLSVYLISKLARMSGEKGHNAAIDGLRGYLAFFVFLHHSFVWYFFLHYHKWGFPSFLIYGHFGPTSVALFFMITAYLFFSKLLDAREGSIDWLKLYIGRFCRVFPLYIAVLVALFIVVGFLSGFRLGEPVLRLLSNAGQWFLFIEPDLNGIDGTWMIIAGVTWSLAFEWLFYFSLVYLGWFFCKIKTPKRVLYISGIFLFIFLGVIIYSYPGLGWQRISQFLGGIAAAIVTRHTTFKSWAASRQTSILILLLMVIAIAFYPTIYEPLALGCMSIAFIGIAAGNDLFGILSHRTARLLGQVSYSIYLVHGLVLFVTFRFIIGFPRASGLSPIAHWSVIAGCTIALVSICTCTYLFIERPGIKAASGITKRIKSFLQKSERLSPDARCVKATI